MTSNEPIQIDVFNRQPARSGNPWANIADVMTEPLQHYEQLMADILKDDSNRDAKFLRIKKGVNAQWEPPAALKALPFIQDRKFA